MAATRATQLGESEIAKRAMRDLRALLPPTWEVAPLEPSQQPRFGSLTAGLALLKDSRGTSGILAVEAKTRVTPRDVDTQLRHRVAQLRQRGGSMRVLVVAPWISPAARERLAASDINFLDLTGNVSIRVDEPALFIHTTGASRDPNPLPRSELTLRGAQAGRVLRLLVDVEPPYNVSELAAKSGVSVSYVSRLLQTLDRQALVERDNRGRVTDASWPGLIRARAEQYDVFATNQAAGFVSPTGPRDVLSRLSTDKPGLYRAVTGSFVAAQIAPVAAPAQLQLYVEQPEETAEGLGLLPTDRGADVILLQPYDYVVLDRPGDPRVLPGLTAVGVSQLALDLLTGNGRMPAEGEAIIAWMSDNPAWRIPDIDSPELGTRAEVYP